MKMNKKCIECELVNSDNIYDLSWRIYVGDEDMYKNMTNKLVKIIKNKSVIVTNVYFIYAEHMILYNFR